MTDLSTRALLLSLNISQWSGRRLDREVTKKATDDAGAAADAGRFNKVLIDTKEMEGIVKVVSATRTGFLTRTLPWMNDGSRIANAATYLDTANWFRQQRDVFQEEVNKFIDKYPALIAKSEHRLSGMFKESDYPSQLELGDKFGMAMNVLPVPSHNDFRVDISAEHAAALRAEIEASVNSATEVAVKDVFDRITDVASRMVDRMSNYKPGQPGVRAEGTFKDSLVENARDLAALLPALNITGDQRISAMITKLEAMSTETADVLRVNESARQDAATKAQDILDTIESYFA